MVLISFALCDERTFKLKSGNKVTGEIINIDDSGNYTVKTSMGEVVFNQNEIVLENVKITTKYLRRNLNSSFALSNKLETVTFFALSTKPETGFCGAPH